MPDPTPTHHRDTAITHAVQGSGGSGGSGYRITGSGALVAAIRPVDAGRYRPDEQQPNPAPRPATR